MSLAPAPICPYCNQTSALVDSAVIYGESYGMIWRCEPCDAHVGVHQDSPNFEPLGTLANFHLRRARNKAHAMFDPLWKSGTMSRNTVYRLI